MKISDPFAQYSVTKFYHFTDRRNLPQIRELGGLYSLARLREMEVEIPCPGGNQWSHDADEQNGVDRYVHLALKLDHPMEYLARQEGRLDRVLYLEIDAVVRFLDGVKFTPDVSNKSGVGMHRLQEARDMIDFEVLYTQTNWGNPAIQHRLQKAEKCEILVPDHVPLKYIRNLPDG